MIDYADLERLKDEFMNKGVLYIREKLAKHGPYILPDDIFNGLKENLYDVNVSTRHECVWATVRGVLKVSDDRRPTFWLHVTGNEEYNNEDYDDMPVYYDINAITAIAHFINWWEDEDMDTAIEDLKKLLRQYKDTDDEGEQAAIIDKIDDWYDLHGADSSYECYIESLMTLLEE